MEQSMSAARQAPDDAGFTLLEVLVALAIFSIAALALLNLESVTVTKQYHRGVRGGSLHREAPAPEGVSRLLLDGGIRRAYQNGGPPVRGRTSPHAD